MAGRSDIFALSVKRQWIGHDHCDDKCPSWPLFNEIRSLQPNLFIRPRHTSWEYVGSNFLIARGEASFRQQRIVIKLSETLRECGTRNGDTTMLTNEDGPK